MIFAEIVTIIIITIISLNKCAYKYGELNICQTFTSGQEYSLMIRQLSSFVEFSSNSEDRKMSFNFYFLLLESCMSNTYSFVKLWRFIFAPHSIKLKRWNIYLLYFTNLKRQYNSKMNYWTERVKSLGNLNLLIGTVYLNVIFMLIQCQRGLNHLNDKCVDRKYLHNAVVLTIFWEYEYSGLV